MKTKISIGFYVNATLLVITIGVSLLLWMKFITESWATSGWDERLLFVLLPSHALAMIFGGGLKMWRLKNAEKKQGIRPAETSKTNDGNEPIVRQQKNFKRNQHGFGETIRNS